MRLLKLKRSLSKEADLALREPTPLAPQLTDYDQKNFVHSADGEAKALKDDGSILFWLIPNAFEPTDLHKAYEHLKTVKGSCANRPETTGTTREMRPRSDGSESNQYRAPLEVVEKYKKMGCEADFLGYYERPYCRQTAWTAKNPEVLRNTWPLVNGADRVFKELLPERHKFQYYHACEAPDFQLGNTAFSTVTVNRKLATTYHRDEGDLEGGFGVMLTLGDFAGGQLVFPTFRVAVDYQPGSMILADVHETHGNVQNVEGDRVTCVLYVRENITKCAGTAEDIAAELAGKMSIHGRTD
jgi:hypothetical protein